MLNVSAGLCFEAGARRRQCASTDQAKAMLLYLFMHAVAHTFKNRRCGNMYIATYMLSLIR